MRHIQLVESWSLSICRRHVLDRSTAGGAKTVRQVQLFGDFSDREFAEWVVDFVDSNGGEADRCSDLVPEDGCRGVPNVSVDELAGNDAVAEEGLTIGEVSVRGASIGGGIVPGSRGEL